MVSRAPDNVPFVAIMPLTRRDPEIEAERETVIFEPEIVPLTSSVAFGAVVPMPTQLRPRSVYKTGLEPVPVIKSERPDMVPATFKPICVGLLRRILSAPVIVSPLFFTYLASLMVRTLPVPNVVGVAVIVPQLNFPVASL